MYIDESEYLAHYGILRKSGRYPWNSGDNANLSQTARNKLFIDYFDDLKRQGLTVGEICRGLGMTNGKADISSTAYRAARSIAKDEQRQAKIAQIERLAAKGVSNSEIGRRMNMNESVVRALRAPGVKEKADRIQVTAKQLKEQIAEKKYLDIGTGMETQLGITSTRFKNAVAALEEQGYTKHYLKIPQPTTRHDTSLIVLAAPGVKYSEVYRNRNEIQQIRKLSNDGGATEFGILPPLSIHPDRVSVKYGKEGGKDADGVIFVREGVPDVSMGKGRYAQVRVLVGDGHYLKGMAMYKDGLPPGVDLVFNTKKENTGNKLDAMKKIEDDPANPFGTIIDQITSRDANGKKHLTSTMNLVNEEGDWEKWSKTLSSQILSKQSPKLAKSQLDMMYESRKNDFDEISRLTNPVVRKKLLQEFSDSVDSASVHLKAAHLPRQASHVILPLSTIRPNEVYAPTFKPGETVVLIRHPHGGTFEIPELTVNNRNPEGRRLLGDARDAIGIHSSVAERLSGADFDGDTVLVIPNGSRKINVTPALKGLKGFDPQVAYKGYEGMPVMKNTQQQMGEISNLITDMTIHGASTEHLARAIRHSMVVIDAEKHKLNYKLSAQQNGIKQLKQEYQLQPDGKQGASTLISRAKARTYVPERKLRRASIGGPIDPLTGKKVYELTGKLNYKTGELVKVRSKKLAETDDAHTLSSGTRMETLYADHSNRLKDLGNQARLLMLNTPTPKMDGSAAKVYAEEAKSLNHKLALAIANRPLERQALVIANATIRMRQDANPNLDDKSLKKMKLQSLEGARQRTGATKQAIEITPSEWDAIQAGAISNNKLKDLLDVADMKVVRALARPRVPLLMTSAKTARAQQMLADGYTREQVASHLGVSMSTLDTATVVSQEGMDTGDRMHADNS